MAVGIPGLLVVDGVDAGDLEEPGVVRLHRRVQNPRQLLHRPAPAAPAATGPAFRLLYKNLSPPVWRRHVTEKTNHVTHES